MRKIFRITILAVFSLFFFGNFQLLPAGSGKTSANFLLENLNAREVGMGGVYAAANKHQEEVITTNPAGIAFLSRPRVSLSYATFYDYGSQGFVSYLQPWVQGTYFRLASAIGVSYYSAGNIDINYADGTSESRTAEQGTAIQFSLACQLVPWLSVGASPKYVRSTLVEQYADVATPMDLGVVLVPFPKSFQRKISFGAAVLNYGSKLTYKTTPQDLPKTESYGVSLQLFDSLDYGSFLTMGQMERSLGEKQRYRLGAEYILSSDDLERALFLRGGFRIQFDDEDYSLGVGFKERNLQLDYAFINTIQLEKKHRITLHFLFGKPDLSRRVREKKLLDIQQEMDKKEKYDLIPANGQEIKKEEPLIKNSDLK